MDEFTDNQVNIVKEAVRERWPGEIDLNFADVEIRHSKGDRTLSTCPAVVWEVEDCTFVVIKIGAHEFKNVFYYRGSRQFGTGIEQYDDLYICVKTLLQVQADFLKSEYNNEANR